MTENINEFTSVKMPILPLRGIVLFPQNTLHFDVGREKSTKAIDFAMKQNRKIFVVAQKDSAVDDPTFSELYSVGVVAEIQQVVKSRGDKVRVMVEGMYRAVIEKPLSMDNFYIANVTELPLKGLKQISSDKVDALMRTVRELYEEYCALSPKMPKDLVVNAMMTQDPVYLVEYIAGNIMTRHEKKQAILAEDNIVKRLQILATLLESENDILSLEKDIYEKVREQVDKNQREYYLREQQHAIAVELGEDDESPNEVFVYYTKIAVLGLSDEVSEKFTGEVRKLTKMSQNSQESSVIRNYLDTCLALPWNTSTKDKIDIEKAEKLLNREHYGMEKVKERILELLAVRKLAPDIKGQIICLVGPPGVGKTSIARSIAKAMGRKYTRMSLGGVRDESDIRGHRKTYVGSMPGRIMTAIKQVGCNNPLMLLDEVDKLGNDFRGDPSSALLEVLDSEQNNTFRDHYIEVPFDLSNVLFLATANTTDTIPGPLLDRMEVIELPSYTREEKFNIAKKYLVKKQAKKNGVQGKLSIADSGIYAIIDFYTREAGVRSLERQIGAICRKAAKTIVADDTQKVTVNLENIENYLGSKKFKPDDISTKDQVGVVNGLAWTSVGGEMLQIEIAVVDGTGKLNLTGSLGDVMKESMQAAVTYVRSVREMFDIDADFYKTKDIHIHVPEGAVPKDGPSAGVTICTALISALTGIPAKGDVAMTGEITLRGRVLPIGGLREKTMAAYRYGMKTVIIPKQNESDLDDIDKTVRANINFVIAETMDDVLAAALCEAPQPMVDKESKAFDIAIGKAAETVQEHNPICQ